MSIIMHRPVFLLSAFLLLMTHLPIHAQEWAAFDRYAEQNQALPPVAEDEVRVVFMGDSITEGWSASYPEFFEGKPYINRGIGGQVTAQMLVRFRADVLQLDPDVVFIMAGTNDIAENQGPVALETVAGHIQSMAELASINGIEPVVCSVLPASHYPWREGPDPATDIPRLNAMLASYAKRMGFRYLDYFSVMTDGAAGLQSELTTDHVHLSIAGYRKLSELAGATLDEIMASR